MIDTRITAAAAALCFGIGLVGAGASPADAGPRVWTANKTHNTHKGSVHVFAPPRLASSKPYSEVDLSEVEDEEGAVTSFTVTTVRPSRRWFRRNRALGQRYLGFKRQYTGQRYTGFKKTYRVRRNVVEVSRGTVTKGKGVVVLSKTLVFPRARGLRDFRPSPEVTVIRYD